MSAVRLVACVWAVMLAAPDAVAQECRPNDEGSASERVRRAAAVDYIDAVNVAQARASLEEGRYVPLAELRDLPSPPYGFIPKLLADRWGYMVTLKDFFNPCGYALFSDERGVIYEAYPRAADRGPSEDASK